MDKIFNNYKENNTPNQFYQELFSTSLYGENPYAYRSDTVINELAIREAIREASLRLLLEIIYLNALLDYYQRLHYQNQSEENYPQQYPNYYHWRSRSNQIISPHKNRYKIKHFHSQLNHSSNTPHENKSFSHFFVHNLVDTAKHNIGRPVWAFGKFASLCQSGYLGCAASISQLLKMSGLKIAGSPSVNNLVNELSNAGWHKIKIVDKNQFHTGDIVYGLKGPHAHIGIITEVSNNRVLVCDNSSASGTLKERTIESGGSFTPNGRFAGHLFVLRKENS